jgi:hypothetical protein
MRRAFAAPLLALLVLACESPVEAYDPPPVGRRIAMIGLSASSFPLMQVPPTVRQGEEFEVRFWTWGACPRARGIDVTYRSRGGQRVDLEPWEEYPSSGPCLSRLQMREEHALVRFEAVGSGQVSLRGAAGDSAEKLHLVTVTHTLTVLPR